MRYCAVFGLMAWVSLLTLCRQTKKATEIQSPCYRSCGEYRIRTDDLLHAMQAL